MGWYTDYFIIFELKDEEVNLEKFKNNLNLKRTMKILNIIKKKNLIIPKLYKKILHTKTGIFLEILIYVILVLTLFY